MTYPFINYHLQVLAAQRTKLEANAKFTTLEEEIQAFVMSLRAVFDGGNPQFFVLLGTERLGLLPSLASK